MPDDDLAQAIVNVAYGCERVSVLAWAVLSACAGARAQGGVRRLRPRRGFGCGPDRCGAGR